VSIENAEATWWASDAINEFHLGPFNHSSAKQLAASFVFCTAFEISALDVLVVDRDMMSALLSQRL